LRRRVALASNGADVGGWALGPVQGTGAFAPGRPVSAQPDAWARYGEPGRAAFELSLALCALALVFPWVGVGAVLAAARSWQKGSRRAWRALLAALWCCILGLVIRGYLGVGVFP
jgi:hypothetical protein